MEDQIENPNGSPQKVIIDNLLIRRSICRYGCGCTHISDPSHREKFWHPPLKSMSGKISISLFPALSSLTQLLF